MDQPTFADLEFFGKKRKTRRELFLERMDGLVPWQKLEERIDCFIQSRARGGVPTHWHLAPGRHWSPRGNDRDTGPG